MLLCMILGDVEMKIKEIEQHDMWNCESSANCFIVLYSEGKENIKMQFDANLINCNFLNCGLILIKEV
jgi:hypothetical protein